MKNLVCFRICGFVIFCGQNRSLGMMDWSFKFDVLQKHYGHWKAIIPNWDVGVGEWYYCLDLAHYKNEKTFVGKN
jgi:hypothetical protein